MAASIGIDLGTTNTVLAVDGVPQPMGAFGANTIPSVVAELPNGKTKIGAEAKRRRQQDPKNTIVSAKRLMAKTWGSKAVERYQESYPLEVVSGRNGVVEFQTRAGRQDSQQVATKVLDHVLEQANLEDADAVVTVPSTFSEAQREATMAAGRSAGLGRLILVDEPVAAASSYLQLAGGEQQRVGVFDLGGGTFDFAVVEWAKGGVKVLASGGDLYLGGDDFDLAIAGYVRERVLMDHGWDMETDREVFSGLIAACETAKVKLSRSDRTTVDVAALDPGLPRDARPIQLTRPGSG